MPAVNARTVTTTSRTSSSAIPSNVAKAATALGLGAFKRTESATGGRVTYTFAKGALLFQQGKLVALRTKDALTHANLEVSKAVLDAAIKGGFGGFTRVQGAAESLVYAFEKGSVRTDARTGKVLDSKATEVKPVWKPSAETAPANVKAAAKILKLGTLKRTESATGGRTMFVYEKGAVKVRQGAIQTITVRDAGTGEAVELPENIVFNALGMKIGAFLTTTSERGKIEFRFEGGYLRISLQTREVVESGNFPS